MRPDFVERLGERGADAVVIDCEDATPANAKAEGRANATRLAPVLAAASVAVTTSGDLILGGQTGVAGSVPKVRKVFGASGLITTMAGGGTLDPDGNGTIVASKVALANVTEVTVAGSHFIQEDSPHEIGEAIADWYRRL